MVTIIAVLGKFCLSSMFIIQHFRYPMALGNLGDLEEISPTPGRPPPLDLFNEAIQSTKEYYSNQHVYPYTYLGGYYYRKTDYRGALQSWAEAANSVKKYVISPFTLVYSKSFIFALLTIGLGIVLTT